MRIAGLGTDQLRTIAVDDTFAMRPELLDETIGADQQAGREPCFVCATVGTTSANAIDPVQAIGEICRRHEIWLHVDAAMSGTPALCPELAETLHDGVELADSYCFNPHKWMFTNFDCDCFWVADRAALIQALTILPEYLRNETCGPPGRPSRARRERFALRGEALCGLPAPFKLSLPAARPAC